MRKFKPYMVLALAVSLIFTTTGCTKKQAIAQETKKKVIPIEVMTLKSSTVTEKYTSFGTAYPKQELFISTKSRAKVQSINYDIGDRVDEGSILYTVDKETLENNYEMKITNLKKVIKDMEVKYEDTLRIYNNIKILYDNKATSKDNLIKAENNLNATELNLNKLKNDLVLTERERQLAIDSTMAISPISGIVSQRNIEVGETSGNADFNITDLSKMNIKVNVSENMVGRISENQEVDIYVDAINKKYEGKVESISPISVKNNGTYPVKIVVNNTDEQIKGGMYVKAVFNIANFKDQIQIPRKSVLKAQNEDYVYIVDEQNNSPVKTTVKTGIVNNGLIHIENGLKEGNKLIISGQEYVDEECEVKIVN